MEEGSLDDGGGGDGGGGSETCNGEVEWVRSQCDLGAISVVRRDLGGGGGTIWAGLGLAGRLELGVELCVEMRLVRRLELK